MDGMVFYLRVPCAHTFGHHNQRHVCFWGRIQKTLQRQGNIYTELNLYCIFLSSLIITPAMFSALVQEDVKQGAHPPV